MAIIEYSADEQLSTHFRSWEWNTKKSKTVKISTVLIEKLETLYMVLGATSHKISSGYRPSDSGSQHAKGTAVDIAFYKNGKVIHPQVVVLTAVYAIGFTGAANISTKYTYTHLDVRTNGVYYGDESNTRDPDKQYSSIWNQPQADGNVYRTFQQYYNISDDTIAQLRSVGTSLGIDSVAAMSIDVGGDGGGHNRSDTVVDDSTETTDAATEVEVQISQEIVDAINASVADMFTSAVENMKDSGYTSRFIGAPFRFLESTDPSMNYETGNAQTSFTEGRGYMYHISAEAPLVHFIPGLPTYLKDFDANNKEALKQYVNNKNMGGEVSSSVINRINDIEGRYFDFVPAYADYMKYVNLLCRMASIYMGIGDKNVPGTSVPYKKYNWTNYQNGGAHITTNVDDVFDGADSWTEITKSVGEAASVLVDNIVNKLSADIFGGYNSVKCYVDASSSFSEDFSNNTKESAVAGLFETAESAVKELNFWAGGTKSADFLQKTGNTLISAVDKIGESVLSLIGLGGSNLDNIGNYAGHIITGSNIIFPEMWGDSSYTKSYNFSISLISPYGDPESIYLNLIQPLMFMLPLVMPRQTSGNSYTSPFLVRVVAKGWFSCDMGIVEGISIEKGGSDAWNINGMPLEIKLGIRVKDLYSSMSMASSSQPGLYFNNPTLIEFLSTTCGVNTIKPNISLKIMTMVNMFSNAATDIPTNMAHKTLQWLNNTVMKWTGL